MSELAGARTNDISRDAPVGEVRDDAKVLQGDIETAIADHQKQKEMQ